MMNNTEFEVGDYVWLIGLVLFLYVSGLREGLMLDTSITLDHVTAMHSILSVFLELVSLGTI